MMQALEIKALCWFANARRSMEDALVECNAWYAVLLAVLLVLAFSIYAGLTIWCLVYKGKNFTGEWYWTKKGVKIRAQCK